jgi:glycosyltransferase involved in cell wall biosynthesis
MRYAFEHQQELKEMGRKGSEYIHTNYNWEKVINDLYNILTARL